MKKPEIKNLATLSLLLIYACYDLAFYNSKLCDQNYSFCFAHLRTTNFMPIRKYLIKVNIYALRYALHVCKNTSFF